MRYEPWKDKEKEYNRVEFEAIVKEALTDFINTYKGRNDAHLQCHTINEWLSTFTRWMSW